MVGRVRFGHIAGILLWLCVRSFESAATGLPGGGETLDERISVRLPAQPLGDALRALAREANLQLLFDADLVAGRVSRPVRDKNSVGRVLDELLRGSGLEAIEQAPGVVVIRLKNGAPAAATATVPAAAPEHPAGAQTQALGEVLITAERRSERLQDVPISVSVHDRATMDLQGARSIDDIARITPGVDFQHGINYNSESSSISIRGIASLAGAATTGVYIDDAPIQSRQLSFGTYDAYPQLFDLERVEVLRGPQGTLFGSGSEGGTLRFITPQPDLERSTVYVRSEAAATDHGAPVAESGIAAGFPLVEDQLAVRASLSYRYEGGYVDRIDWHTREDIDPDSNAGTTKTARIALKWAVSEELTVTPSFFLQYRHVDDTAAWWAIESGARDPTAGQFDQPLRNGNAIANPSTDILRLSSFKVDWNLGSARLLSSTSYFERDQSAVTDYTEYDRAVFLGNPFPPAGVAASTYWADDQSNWTQELRAESTDPGARARWTAGVFYQHAYERTVENVFDPALVAQLDFPVYAGGYLYYQQPFSGLDTQVAAFGQLDLKLSDPLTLTVGLRESRARYEGVAYYAGPAVGTPVYSTGSSTEYPLTPKFGLEYRLDPASMLYATVAKGYRIGGTNPAVGQFCYGGAESALGSIGLDRVPPQYHSDSVWSYEVGSKSSFDEGRALIDASVYLIHWSGIQQNVPLNACGFQFTANLGAAESRGVDMQAEFRPTPALLAGATLSVTDAFYTRTVKLAPTALAIVESGDHIPGSPWKAALFSQADLRVLSKDAYLRLDFQYAARQSDTVPGQDPRDGLYGRWTASVPTQSDASLRAGVKWGGYDLSLFAQNVFDTLPRLKVNQDVATPSGGTPLLYVISWRPRTVGVTLTLNY
jgi:outer membrane receptor protein involved in Fe transport